MSDSITYGPDILQPSLRGDIVGSALQNTGDTATPVMPLTMGQVFRPGTVMPTTQLIMRIGGQDVPVQMNPVTFNSDGSVADATLTFISPALAANSSTNAMLAEAPDNTPTPSLAISLADALKNYSLSANLDFTAGGSGGNTSINLVAALESALANGTAKIVQSGPLASEASTRIQVGGSFALTADITAYANGTFSSSVTFDNDDTALVSGDGPTMPASYTGPTDVNGGTATYTETLVQNGQTVSNQTVTQYQYQNWNTTVGTAGPQSQVNVQHDIAYLEATGLIPNYDTTLGMSPSVLQDIENTEASAGFGQPLAVNGVTQYMPGVGGRYDIGPTTGYDAAWLLSQNPEAAVAALAQADTAGAVPWNFFNTSTGDYFTSLDSPNIWTSPTVHANGTTYPQQPAGPGTGWATDIAHQPDLSYDAYLLTGNQNFLDELNTQAAFSISSYWPADVQAGGRNDGQDLLADPGQQTRGVAWTMREVQEAASVDPPGSTMQKYFQGVEDSNYAWMVQQIPTWTATEGQPYGWYPGNYGASGNIPPWQDDYLVSTVAQAALQGNADAKTFLAWESNFIVGRFLNEANGFNPRDGVNYNLTARPEANGPLATTWAELDTDTALGGRSVGDPNWQYSNGDYAQLALESLSDVISVFESPEAMKAYGWLLQSGAPFIDLPDMRNDPMFDIVPRLSDGNLLTYANETVSTDAAGTTNTIKGSNADQLLEAGAGNDTVIGGTGINLEFGGSGNDVLLGGGNNDYLFAGTGSDILEAGGGTNYLDSNTGGPNTFVFDTTDTASNTVADFRVGTDKLFVEDASGNVLSPSALQAILNGATTDGSGDTVLKLSPTNTVTLQSVALSDLTLASFATSLPAGIGAPVSGSTTAHTSGTGLVNNGSSIHYADTAYWEGLDSTMPPSTGTGAGTGTTPPSTGNGTGSGTTPPSTGSGTGTTPPSTGIGVGTTPPAEPPLNSAPAAVSVPQATEAGDIVGLNLQNVGSATSPAQLVTFGEVFKAGAVAPGEELVMSFNGEDAPVQVDAKTFNPDGSVAIATITAAVPGLAAGATTGVMLMKAPPGALPHGDNVDLESRLGTYGLNVTLALKNTDGTTTTDTINAAASLQSALRNGTATIVRQGSLATEASVRIPVSGSLSIVADITAFDDGSFTSDISFDNDAAMQATGGTATYDETVTQNGQVVSQQNNITQYQYQNWHTQVGTNTPSTLNVQHDVTYLESTGDVPGIDTTLSLDPTVLKNVATAVGSASWGQPLSANGVAQYMPQGQQDQGATSSANAAWLIEQSPTTTAYALGQADAAGAVPWNMYDPTTGEELTTATISNIWTEWSSHTNGTTQLTQEIPGGTGWSPDPSNQPDLTYIAYLMTGNQYYLNELNAQAAWSETSDWPATQARNNGQGLVVQNPPSVAASSLREIDEAAQANPSGSAMQKYFQQMEDNNYAWLVQQIPAWTAEEGQAHGYLPSGMGGSGVITPGTQDLLANTVALAAENGNADAKTFLNWMSNFIVGRFTNGATGLDPNDGVTLNLNVQDPTTGKFYTTWSAIGEATAAAGNSNGTGWSQGYAWNQQAALQSLADVITVDESPEAIKTYGEYLSSGAPYITPTQLSTNPQFDVAPELSDGNFLTGNNIVISHDAVGTANTITGTNADQMLVAGAGTDKVVGGSGMNILFAGTGNDALVGGPGNDYLYGGNGTDTLSGGGGTNYLDAGTGATTFAFNQADTATNTVADFKVGTDKLSVTNSAGGLLTPDQAQAIISGATTDASGDAVLQLSPTNTAALQSVAPSQLTVSSFDTGAAPPSTGSGAGTTPPSTGAGSGGTSPPVGVWAGAGAPPGTGAATPSAPGTGATITGGSSPWGFVGTSSVDNITGGSGAANITGGSGGTNITGGSGAMAINQTTGNMVVNGGSGNISMNAGAGDLTFNAGSGITNIAGGSGNMAITFGTGDSAVEAGTGDDTFSFDNATANNSVTIDDFDPSKDYVEFKGFSGTAYSSATMNKAATSEVFAMTNGTALTLNFATPVVPQI